MALLRSTNPFNRLRASTCLAALALLLFGLNVGVAAACVGYDCANLDLGSVGKHAAANEAMSGAHADRDRTPSSPTHASTCSHCSCHQTVDITASPVTFVPVVRTSPDVAVAGLPPNPAPGNQLRPPIA